MWEPGLLRSSPGFLVDLLELHRRSLGQRRVQPLAVIDLLDEGANVASGALEIGVERRAAHRGVNNFVRLTLRLPEEGWARFGNLSSITGTGAVRHHLLSAIVISGDRLAGQLVAFREAHG